TPTYSAIVLVVDLFPAPGETDSMPEPSPQWDKNRVQQHLDGWTEGMIDTFRGFAAEAKYICLFINKYDLIEPRSEMVEKQIRRAFAPLVQRLEVRSRGAEFDVVVGSLSDHMGVTKVFSQLVSTACRVN
ncbi:MAG TPA: hypothetical protein VFO36_09665, partial [Nitrospiraceae bacterium]|nr:hypothetical protein [Nitrospiraceae bacterium]